MEKLTAEQLVARFGNDKQKDNYRKSGKLESKTRIALIKIAETEFESVSIVKEGRSNIYILSGERAEPIDKVDARVGKNKSNIAYTESIDFLVVWALRFNEKIEKNPQTMRKWLLDFGLVSDDLFNLYGLRTFEAKLAEVERLEESGVKAFDYLKIKRITNFENDSVLLLNDYINYSTELMGQLENSLNRLAKKKIINLLPEHKAKIRVSDEEGSIAVTTLTPKTVAEINSKRIELKEKYEISEYDINFLFNKKEVVEFKKEWQEYLSKGVMQNKKHINIVYLWKCWAVHLRVTKDVIERYLYKNIGEDEAKLFNNRLDMIGNVKHVRFANERAERVVELAKRKKEKNMTRAEEIKDNKDDLLKQMAVDGNTLLMTNNQMKYSLGYHTLLLSEKYVDAIEALEYSY